MCVNEEMKCKGREELSSFTYVQKPVSKVKNLTCTVDRRPKARRNVLDVHYPPETSF